jgi:hypothetical protein
MLVFYLRSMLIIGNDAHYTLVAFKEMCTKTPKSTQMVEEKEHNFPIRDLVPSDLTANAENRMGLSNHSSDTNMGSKSPRSSVEEHPRMRNDKHPPSGDLNASDSSVPSQEPQNTSPRKASKQNRRASTSNIQSTDLISFEELFPPVSTPLSGPMISLQKKKPKGKERKKKERRESFEIDLFRQNRNEMKEIDDLTTILSGIGDMNSHGTKNSDGLMEIGKDGERAFVLGNASAGEFELGMSG